MKRRVYRVALIVGALILLLSWFLRAPGDMFIAYAYPPLAMVLAGLGVLSGTRAGPLEKVESAMFVIIAALVLARLFWHFHLAGPLADQIMPLAAGHYWAVAALLVGCFVLFDRFRGLAWALVVLAVAVLIAFSGIARDLVDGRVPAEVLGYLLRVHLFLVVLVALASAATVMRDRHRRILIRAEVLDQWANTDALTGLPNRRAAERVLHRRLLEAQRHGRPLSLILFDLDRFKSVNDTHGHATGDHVLEGLGRRLNGLLRESDLLARWGGEEFLIVAPETGAREAAMLAERCRIAIADEPIAGVGITGTFGVAELVSDDDVVDTLLARADAMLYEGKEGGRNRVVTAAEWSRRGSRDGG
ncbi:diguanylate cyclase/phosphodiesterase (GGDEF & EAL domains) with PAS/PAC sensor(s) [Thioalkalivibrio nitratireducens DSM 14787]|uniref:diguanylate cyclase n=1 Tax=Thioalkalivibrio nitratireducens (strain DSM 14787 / UNIQEM 213 / ALEN2) TaxID=1255043 RepID=L0DW06_THIND|nr:diguanylate cyclase/phosphodiesterase (GGDEF & EAL domains) with PAS/PAC sensor(s) [Thioalkalivibrio nitratireducens DSM 14787]